MSNTFIVDDQDASIKYTGSWSLAGQQQDLSQTASSGSSGATMSFSFSGNLISVVGDLHTGEICNATFNIDGVSNNFTSLPTNNNQYQQTLWTSPTLSDGNHTLVYTVAPCNNSNSAPWIDYLLYTSSSTSVAGRTTFIDDRDSHIAYTGTWNSTPGEYDFQGTITSVEQGSSFSFDFEGTSIQVFGCVDNASIGEITDASFSVDGAPPVSFTAVTSSEVVHNKQFYTSRILDPGQHRLAVRNTGSIPLWVDYILVRGQSTIGGTAPSTGDLGNSHRHEVTVVVAPVVGGVCGILVLIGIAILFRCYRHKIRLITKRLGNMARKHDGKSPPETTDLDDTTAPHHPRFIAHNTSSSLSEASSAFEERRSLTRRQLPLPHPQNIYDASFNASDTESGYRGSEVNYVDRYSYPRLSREGSYASLPNPYSTRHSHRSYSESSVSPSVSQSHTMRSTSFANATSENFSSSGTGGGGYGFSFIPTRDIERTLVGDDSLSDADIKQRQGQFFVLSVDGMTVTPLVHTDSGLRLHSPRNDVDPELQPELPPMYTVE